MSTKISLNDFTIRQAPFHERFAIAQEAGFKGVEFQIEEARNYAKKHKGMRSVLEFLQVYNLRFDQSLMLWDCFSTKHLKDRARFMHNAELVFRDTKYLGGEVVLACTTFEPVDINTASDIFAEMCDMAGEFGLKLALEFIGWAETIKNIKTAWYIVDKAGRKNGGILVDTIHLYFGGSSLIDLEELPSELLFTVHLSDACNSKSPVIEIARHHRLFPSKGEIPIIEILSIIRDKGYSSSFALEIFNDEYLKRPVVGVAIEGYKNMVNVLSKAGYDTESYKSSGNES